MADTDDAPPTDEDRSTAMVIDLREDVPVRRRQMRGLPRESDRALRAYRDAAAQPMLSRPAALVVEVAAEPRLELAESPTDAGEALQRPTVQAERGGDGRQRFLIGDLVIRRLKLRSVAKVALVFFLCLLAMVLIAGVLLWNLANRAGWVTNWTGFLVDLGFTDATVDGPTIFRASALAGLTLVATATFLSIAAAVMYNQISGLVGGFEMSLRSTKRHQSARLHRPPKRQRRRRHGSSRH